MSHYNPYASKGGNSDSDSETNENKSPSLMDRFREEREELKDRVKSHIPMLNHQEDDDDHPNTTFHVQDFEEIAEEQKVDIHSGLSSSEAENRLKEFGENVVASNQESIYWKVLKMLVHQFTDFMVILLLVSGLVSIFMKEYVESGTLFFVVLTNVVIGFVQEWKAEKALQSLKSFNTPNSQVLRDSKVQTVKSSTLVPGDIVLLEEGSSVPADLRLFDLNNCQVMEATLTGESTPVEKTCRKMTEEDANKRHGEESSNERKSAEEMSLGDRRCMGYMSTLVVKGRSKGIVVSTGHNTEVGRISSVLQKMQKKNSSQNTALQKRIRKLGAVLVGLSLFLCGLVVAIAFIRQKIRDPSKIDKDFVKSWINTGVALAVSVIPEGLVAVVTVTFALGVQRMAKRNAIVRKLSAVETLGSITVICADKTGTLTIGTMKAEEMFSGGKKYSIEGSGYCPKGNFNCSGSKVEKAEGGLLKMMMIGSLCNNSDVERKENEDGDGGKKTERKKEVSKGYHSINSSPEIINSSPKSEATPLLKRENSKKIEKKNAKFEKEEDKWKGIGDPTEVAIEVAARKLGLGKEYWLKTEKMEFVKEIPFDSDRSRMTTVYKVKKGGKLNLESEGKYVILCKGASSSIIPRCTAFLSSDEKTFVPKSEKIISEIEEESEKMAVKGLRVLSFAYKFVDSIPSSDDDHSDDDSKNQLYDSLESDLQFVGMVGIVDPPREEVKFAIEQCKEAGIGMCMITGDHKSTAFGVASSLGLVHKDRKDLVLEGHQIDKLSTSELAAINPFPVVFARVSPENKLKIIKALKRRGEITAMTGDGVNDAPAIRFADAGISMGKSGTELTKESSDIILTDDNLNSIIPAIEEGRRTFDNIQKFIFYLLACNSAEIWVMLLAIIADSPPPFTPIMILWANIILDIPPAMALGIDPPARDVLQRPPRDPKKGIFPTWRSYLAVIFHGLSMAGLSLGLFYIGRMYLHHPDPKETANETDHSKSFAFVGLGVLQLIHAFLAKQQNRSIFNKNFWVPINWWLIGGFLGSLALLIGGNYAPLIANGALDHLDMIPLYAKDWIWIAGAVLAHIFVCELLKLILNHGCLKEGRKLEKEQEKQERKWQVRIDIGPASVASTQQRMYANSPKMQ